MNRNAGTSQEVEHAERLAEIALEPGARRLISWSLAAKIARQELAKGRSEREALKRLKQRLHQLVLSFEAPPADYAGLSRLFDEAAGGPREELKLIALSGMRLHSSTRERLPIMGSFFAKVLEGGPYGSVLDLGCGLNPLALPWMGLKEGTKYLAVDASSGPGAAVLSFFRAWGAEGGFLHSDISEGLPEGDFEVAMLLKMFPTLERIREGLGTEVVKSVRAPVVVVSFPTRSLSGRGKGMGRSYEQGFTRLSERSGWSHEVVEMPGELAFIVRK